MKLFFWWTNVRLTIWQRSVIFIRHSCVCFLHAQVTKREYTKKGIWTGWKWRSSNDVFMNGAYFVQSGWGSCAPGYSPAQSFAVAHGVMVPALTSNAGTLSCVVGKACWFGYKLAFLLYVQLFLFLLFLPEVIYIYTQLASSKHVCTREYVVGRKLEYESL